MSLAKVREFSPSPQQVERNLFWLGWMLILPSVSLFFEFRPWIAALLVAGCFIRLIRVVLQLPTGQRGFFHWLPKSFAVWILLLSFTVFPLRFLLLPALWGFLAYAEWRLHRHQRLESRSPESNGRQLMSPAPESVDP